MNTKWCRMAGVAGTVLLLAGCGGGPATQTEEQVQFSTNPTGELKAWGFDNADDVGKARLDYAKSKLSGVTITLDATGFDAQKFTTRLASGDVPDVVQMDRQFVATYAAQDLILPVDACFKTWSVDPHQHFYPAVTADVTWNDKLWAVPQFFQPAAIMLNQRVLKQEGVDAAQLDTSKPDQLVAVAKKLATEKGGNPSRLGLDPVPTGQGTLWLLGYGGRLADENGRPALDDPNNVKAVAFLKQLVDAQGGWAKVKSFTDAFDTFGKNNQFVTDQVASQVDAQWYVNVLSPYADKIELGATPFKDQSGKPFAVTGGTSFVIPAKAKNPDAACAWMISLVTDDAWLAAGAARTATLKTSGAMNTGLFTGSPSADKAVRERYVKPSGNSGFDQTIQTYYDVVANGKSFGPSPAGQTIQSELNNAITAALLGQKTSEQALADAQAASLRAYEKVAG